MNTGKNMYKNLTKISRGVKITILQNRQVKTDRTIPKKKPDVIICDNEKGTRMLMDVNSEDVIKEHAQKILQYEDLTIQIQHVCKKQK